MFCCLRPDRPAARQVAADGRQPHGAVCVLRVHRARPAAHRASHVARRHVAAHANPQVPLARQLLHHRLVPSTSRPLHHQC